MFLKFNFDSNNVKPEDLPEVVAAVATLTRLTNYYPSYGGRELYTGEVAVDPVAVVTSDPVEAVETVDEPKKPRKKRRTKAEIAADNAAKEGKQAVAPAEDTQPFLDDPSVSKPTEATDATNSALDAGQVKGRIVAAVRRLTDGGTSDATGFVVDTLVKLVGKAKVTDVDPSRYAEMVLAVDELGV